MALSYDDAMTALRNADAAGDTEAAQRLAGIASTLRSQAALAPTKAPAPPTPEILGTPQGYAGRVAAIPTGNAPVAPTPQPAPPTLIQKAKGAVEAALNTVDALVGGGVGAAGGFLGGLAGAAATGQFGTQEGVRGVEEAMAQGAQQGTEFVGRTRRAFGPAPTPIGQEYTENVGEALQQAVPVAAVAHALPPANLGPAARALGDVGRRAGTRAAESVVPNISPQRAANVQAGMEQGLTFAPHQLAESKFVKMAGESAEHVPASFGGMRRAERQEAFNRALIKHVNPESDAPRLTGEVLGEAMDRSGGKIGEITSGTGIPLEDVQGGFEAQRRALGRTSEDNRRVVGGYIDEFERLAAENNGTIPGAAFKDLNSELGRDIRSNAGNPLGNKLSDLQDVVLDAFRGKLDPEARVAYDTSRTEYAKAKTLLPLVAKSVEGDISPGALMGAVTATKAGKEAMGRGRGGELGELARAGRYLVDQKSSGTAERSLIQQLILDPIAGAAKVATVYPAAAAYNLAGPAISRAMVRKGLRRGGAEPPPEATLPSGGEPPPGGAGPAGEPSIPVGEATEITPQVVEPAVAPTLDPRLAEIERLKTSADSDAVRAALDEHAKTVQKDIAAKAATAKQTADVRALERAARAAEDPALRTALQAKADKLRAEKIPIGETKELATTPTPPVEKPGKIPVGKVIEGQPELPAAKVERIPVGQATELPVEKLEPAPTVPEPIPVGEATEVQPVPAGTAAEMIPTGEATEVPRIPVGKATEIASEVIEPAQAPEYAHTALFTAAEKRGIETRGRRPSEVRTAVENAVIKEHKLNPFEAERAKAVAKALDIDEKAVENAAVQHERSPRMFDKAIDRIIEQRPERTDQIGAQHETQGKNVPSAQDIAARLERQSAESFASTLPPMQRARVLAALDESQGFNGVPKIRRIAMKERVNGGATIENAKEGRRLVLPNGSYLSEKAITKTAMDYADFLIKEREGTPNAPETKQATGSREGTTAEPAAERAAGAAPAATEQPGANRPATPGTASEGNQPGGQGEATAGIVAIPETRLEPVAGKKQWNITLKSKISGRTKEVAMPGGLSEAEAARGAVLNAGNDWMVSRQDLGRGAEPRGFEKGAQRLSSREWVEQGSTPEQKLAFKVKSEGEDLARTVLEEARTEDFDPKELPQIVRQRADEAKVPADELRQAMLKHLDDLGMKKATLAKVRNALDPTKQPRGFEKGAQRSPQADHEAAKAEVARRRALGDVQKTQTVEEIQRGFEKGAQRPSPLQAKLQRAAEVSGRDVGELTKIYERYAADEGEAAAMARLDRTINAKPKGYVKKVADAAIEAISPEDLLHRLEQLSKRANRAGYQPLTEAEFASLKDTGLTTGTKWSTGKLTGDGFSKLHELKSEDTARGNAIANAEDLIQDNQPFKASAVDEYGLKVPEGYIREGEMYRPKKGT